MCKWTHCRDKQFLDYIWCGKGHHVISDIVILRLFLECHRQLAM
jgi:hypothetical protein